MVSMSTGGSDLTHRALAGVAPSLRTRLLKTYAELKTAFVEGQFDACGLRAGKFCEIVLRVLQEYLSGTHIALGQKIPNFKVECDKIEQLPATAGPESLRLLMPRALDFLYTLRNKRGIGHVGGDVDANEIDAATCVRVADWCLSELIRVFHNLSIEEAQDMVNTIAERRLPLVWQIQGKKRVLSNHLNYKSQVLLLLYSEPVTGVPLEELLSWTENPRKDNFVRTVIAPMHQERLIEFDRVANFVFISPKGSRVVEEQLLGNAGEV
jgi:hypothetical protein